jgi:NAD(P)-dependent dehydrogenase (short-subunit alcohol dehydrogenase family)
VIGASRVAAENRVTRGAAPADNCVVERIVVVTGAGRGLGREVVRQFVAAGDTVLQTSRGPTEPEAGAVPMRLDVAEPRSMAAFAREVADRFGRVDVLVNNAAIHYDTWQTAADADLGVVREALETNLLGAWRLTQELLPAIRNSGHGRIVNVSSEAGSLASMGGGTPAYSVSKAALNALTRMLAAELRKDRILVNAICPGWVATDMGGPGGRPVADGASGIRWAADLPDDGPSGGFFRDGRPLPW